MALFGNDVSSNNGASNVDLKNNAFSIVKISEGTGYYNPSAYNQSKQVQDAGKLLGYYHWLTPGIDAVEQAKYFLTGVGDDAYLDNIILALDYEQSGLTGDEAKPFLDYIYKVTGKRALIYMSASWAAGNGGKFNWNDICNDYPLWVAGGLNYAQNLNYSQYNQTVFNMVNFWKNITIWQYSSNPYDRNVLFGDANTWKKIGSKVTTPSVVKIAKPKPKPVAAPNYAYKPKNAPKFDVGTKVQILPKAYKETNGHDLTPRKLWQGVIKKITPVQWSDSEYEYWVTYNNGARNEHVLEQDLQLWASTNN